jgi:thiamine transporter
MTKQAESAQRVKILSEATIFVALSIVLKDVLPPIWHMPQGGSITIAGLVPLIWFALRRGAKWGIFAGFVYGLVHALLPGSYLIHPVQVLLDYPLAFAAVGLAGMFRKIRNVGPIAGTALGISGRFACSFLSGLLFFVENPFSTEGMVASAVYNGTYLIPEFVITVIVLYVLLGTRLLHIYE